MACDYRNADIFQSYLRTESPLVKVLSILLAKWRCPHDVPLVLLPFLQIRSEQQAMEAVKPFLHTLLENRCYTAYDILYNVRGIGELVSWNLPGPLARSIYSVIQEIHEQSTRVSKRNIVREARVSADFEHFLKNRVVVERDQAPAAEVTPVEEFSEPVAEHTVSQVRSRLETEVLGLPLQDLSLSASELLFKAAFVVDGGTGTDNPTTPDTYQRFLHSLLALQAAGNIETMKQLIAARVAQAKAIADEHFDIFKLFGVAIASDLLVR